jgi:hypothetical protein
VPQPSSPCIEWMALATPVSPLLEQVPNRVLGSHQSRFPAHQVITSAAAVNVARIWPCLVPAVVCHGGYGLRFYRRS